MKKKPPRKRGLFLCRNLAIKRGAWSFLSPKAYCWSFEIKRQTAPYYKKGVPLHFVKQYIEKSLKAYVIKEIGPRPFELTLGNDLWPKQMDSG